MRILRRGHGIAASLILIALLPAASAGATSGPWQQQAKLEDSITEQENGHFGVWTAIEGNTAVVSAPDEIGSGNVWVFHRETSGHWAIEAVLDLPEGPEGISFGQSVGLLGNTIVVGTWGDERAVVFQRSPSLGWLRVADLRPSDGKPGNSFGFSVAISSSGILVGDFSHDGYRGAAYFYKHVGYEWRQSAELLPPPGTPEGMSFGLSVALDGSTAAVGAPAVSAGKPLPGEGFVYQQGSEGGWSEAGRLRLEGGGNPGDLLGRSVAITGREVVMGATAGNIGVPGYGSAYVFTPTVHGYSDGVSLLSSKPKGFGYSAAASGPELLVGAIEQEGSGAVYAFHHEGPGNWSLQQKLTSTVRVAGARFGNGVALDASNLLIGADEVGEGAAYVFG